MDLPIQDKYAVSRWAYKVGQELITDEEYNHLHRQMLAQFDSNPLVHVSWSSDREPTALLEKYKMAHLRQEVPTYGSSESIDTCVTIEEVYMDFANLTRGHLSYKIDGHNIILKYVNGFLVMANTRGRTGNGKEILQLMVYIVPKTIPTKNTTFITVELHTNMNYWEVVEQIYSSANPRSAVTTLIAEGQWQYLLAKAFSIKENDMPRSKEEQYKTLQEFKFVTAPGIVVRNYADLLLKIDMLGKVKNTKDFKSDGVVLHTDSKLRAIRIGAWQEAVNYSNLTGWDFSPTTYGFSIAGLIEPIKFGGANRSSVNLYNPQKVIDNNIKKGDRIFFVLRSDANLILDPNKYE